jgi:hypothetical protein
METDIAKQQIRIERRSPAYWEVVRENPLSNIFGPRTIPQLHAVIADRPGSIHHAAVPPTGRAGRPDPLLDANFHRARPDHRGHDRHRLSGPARSGSN